MRVLIPFGLLFISALACPPLVEKFCKCEELHNGVKLDCSHIKGYDVVQILRQNQVMLGLVQELKMQKAELKKLPASFFAGLYIKQLDLSFNEMTDIDDNAFQGMSPVLQEISLHHNNLTKIPVGALTDINTLLRLDLSNNTIGDLGETDAFPNLPKLYDINLGNNKICSVHSSIFQKIKNTVQTISLGHNCLKAVPASAVRGLTQLQAIHLLKNNINQLEALNFLNLPVLNLLNLAGNNISDINRQAFLNVPNLRYLYLTDNKISKVASGQFVTFEKLEMLDLTRNKIEKIQAGSFSQLPSLTRLYLGSNEISSIEKGAFTNSSIVILVLSNNKLQTLNDGILDGLLNLQQVSFQHNQIKEIDKNAFYNAPSVALVDLSYNQIFDLPPSTFLAQLNLFMIDLSSNKLVRTPYAAFNRRVGTIMLKENPLVCTEKVHLIQDGIGTYLPSESDLICGGKPTTTGKPVQIKLAPKHSAGERVMKPTGAFQQTNLRPVPEPSEGFVQGEPDLLPTRSERPEVLNVRPVKVRGPSRSDIAHTDSAPEIEMETGAFTENNSGPITTEEEANAKPQPSTEEEALAGPEDVSENAEETPSDGEALVDGAKSEVQGDLATTVSPSAPTTLGQRVYTDIADNPKRIFPFPVPFLKQGPKMHQAQRISFTSTDRPRLVQEHTLPPSIVIEPRARPANPNPELVGNSIEETEKIEKFAAPQANTISEKKEPKGKVSESRFSTGIIIVVVCISLAVLCMIVVFVALCLARCRNGSRFTSSYSDSSVARTNAYVQSQAHMNMIYGTLGRERCPSMPHEEAHPWVYNPGPNYCNYYKPPHIGLDPQTAEADTARANQSRSRLLFVMLPWLALLLLATGATAYCPEIFANQTDCSCTDYIDGAVVRCSGPDGPRIVEEMKKSHYEIKELVLEQANIVELGPNAFRNLRIKKLVLDKNRIKAFHKDSFKGLENVLMELSVAANHLPEVPHAALGGLRALRILNLKCNRIGNLTKPLFQNNTALLDVDLSCNKICNVSDDVFSAVRGGLQNLILDNNCLTEFPSAAVQNMEGLIALHIQYNKLNQLPEGALTNLTSLSLLTLSGNNISTIHGEAVVNSNNIHYLYLAVNNLHQIDGGVMSQFRQVQVLDLSHNFFEEITVDSFAGLDSLQHLNLDSNAIRHISPKAFEGKPLLLLWLPNNCINSISPAMFTGAPYLRQVSLSNNNIREIESQSFGHLPNLHHLDLSNNKILTLQSGSINGPDHLTTRLQENPMVCGQDGFHVLNGGEAVNLTSEANLICKTNWQAETPDLCPKAVPRPPAPPCCSQRQTPITLAPTTTTTTTTAATTTEATTTFTEAVKSMKTTTQAEEEEGENNEEDTATEEEDEDTATTTVKAITHKINMDRFHRLQNTRLLKKPVHKPNHKPRYLVPEPEEGEEDDEDKEEAVDDEDEEKENTEEEETTTTTTTTTTSAPRKLPPRVRDRHYLVPWMQRGKSSKPSSRVEEDFNKDEEAETVQVDQSTRH